jgi:hypothetical protein
MGNGIIRKGRFKDANCRYRVLITETEKGGAVMKRFKARHIYPLFIFLILGVSFITGCGGGGETGKWLAPSDTTAPTVTGTINANGATGVAINTKVGATFSEAMDPLTITAATFTLTGPGGAAVAGAVSYTGVSAVFTPAAFLAVNTPYTATITTGAKDLAGNPLAANYGWSWTTGAIADATAPTVTGTINADGATGVAINTKVGATFSEGMDPLTITNLTFTFKETVSGAAVAGTTTYSGVSAVFIPASALTVNTRYTATITTGAEDLAGNPLAANYGWSWTTGATADTTAPMVTGTINANGASGVAIDTKVGATFSEWMDPLTITNLTFTFKETVSGAAVAGLTSYSGVSAVFTPASALTANTRYTATIKGGVGGAADLAGIVMVADYGWSWTTAATADTTAPTVTATVNADGASGVPINTKVGATFSEGMDPLTITNLTFTFKETVSGAAVAGLTSYSGVNAVFTPASALTANTRYTATIKGGVGGAADLAGIVMVADYGWSWTTAATPDTTRPWVIGTINADGAINVATNTKVGATFSEAMDPLTITNTTFTLTGPGVTPVSGLVTYTGVNAVFTPAADLAASTLFTATITTGATDIAGNAMAANYVWRWTTGLAPDIIRPTVTATNPDALAVGVCMNKTINATFSEAMEPLTITTATFTLAETVGGATVTGVVAYDALTKIATFDPAANLTGAPATGYTATIKSGVSGVKDLAGNELAADKVWTFTTNASTCALAPALGAMAPFGAFGGNATLTNDGLGTTISGDIGVNAASTKITGLTDSGGNVYTITPTNNGLVDGLVYTLTAPPGSVAGAVVTQAGIDALAAYTAISPTVLLTGIAVEDVAACPSCGGGAPAGPGQLGGRTLPPGVYESTPGTYSIGALGDPAGNLTLDAGGDANAVWIFQMAAGAGGKLTVGLTGPNTPAVPIQVLLINGALPKNVFWYVPGGATIGTGATMAGTILSDASTTFSTTGLAVGEPLPGPNAVTTTLNGRAIALTAAVTMTNTVINVPAP